MRSRRVPLLGLMLVLAVACQPSARSGPTPSAEPSSRSPSPSALAGTAYPASLTDDAGRAVTLPAEPQRIVSLAPSNTEIVCALGACDRLVGVTDFDDYPAEVAGVQHVVINAAVDVELVVAANPDLVLAAGNELTPSSVITELAGLGLPVLVVYPGSLDEVITTVQLVGAAIGAADATQTLVATMQANRDAVLAAVAGLPRPRTFYEVGVYEGVIYTAGAGSFLGSMIDLAGGEPIFGDSLTTAIALEDLVAADPDLILLGDATYDPSITPESVAARSGWGTMTAVVNGQIVVVLEDLIITRPGPRIIEGLAALARAIHPEAFPATSY